MATGSIRSGNRALLFLGRRDLKEVGNRVGGDSPREFLDLAQAALHGTGTHADGLDLVGGGV